MIASEKPMKKNRITTALAVSLASISALSLNEGCSVESQPPEPPKPQSSPTSTVQSRKDELEIQERRVRGVVILDLVGEFKAAESNVLLRKAISDLLLKREQNIILNLAGITSMDEIGIKGLASNFQLVGRTKGQIKLLNPTPGIKNLLATTNLVVPFGIYFDESSAIDSFNLGIKPPCEARNCKTRKELEECVRELIVEELGVHQNEVTAPARLREDLGADSLDITVLLMRFEVELDVEIPDEDAEKLEQVSAINDYLWRKVCPRK